MQKKVYIFFVILLIFVLMAVVTWWLKGGQSQPVSEKNEQEDVAGTKIISPVTSRVRLVTTQGDIIIELFADSRPKTVQNFISLAESGFYNGVKFHRIIQDFMIQTGDPLSKDDNWSDDGTGGPGYTIEDEFRPDDALVRGSVAMANTGMPHTNGSQFFIVTAESVPWLNGKHTFFGRVVDGMDVITSIAGVAVNENDHPLEDIVIQTIEVLIDTDKI